MNPISDLMDGPSIKQGDVGIYWYKKGTHIKWTYDLTDSRLRNKIITAYIYIYIYYKLRCLLIT